MDGRSIIQMSHREMEKQTVEFFSGLGANTTLTGNHEAASTKLQLRLEFKGVCQVGERIFVLGFSCLRQTQHKSPKSGKAGYNSAGSND